MKLKSPVFKDGEAIPQKYTCQGLDISPPLIIEEINKMALSLAIVMEDPDVPLEFREDGLWVHWVLYNLSPDVVLLEEATKIGTQGLNTGTGLGYMGPCPPDRRHRYFFTVYSLNKMTDFPEGLSKVDLLKSLDSLVLDKAVLMGTYEKV